MVVLTLIFHSVKNIRELIYPLFCPLFFQVKETVGLGTSLDVIVVNGRIREGETIVLAGQEGPIVTSVRGVLVPAPMSELRVKGNYEHLKEVVGAQGVKIIAKDLEKALAGLPLYVAKDLAEELFYRVGSLLFCHFPFPLYIFCASIFPQYFYAVG